MSYPTEAIAWTDFLKDKYPNGAKVTQLVYNNDFGKSYQKQFEKDRGRQRLRRRVHRDPRADVGSVQRGHPDPGL